MTEAEFNVLSQDLRNLVVKIPLRWGAVQNDRVDDDINMFEMGTFDQLESAIARLPDAEKNYLRRRWYLWKCSICDEYLFYVNPNVEKNPNQKDKEWDVRIDNAFAFDIKGTVIPREMRNDIGHVLQDPAEMVDFYYDNQSTGRRFDIQNRLFIVHHSFVDNDRELYLRCAWKSKRAIYNKVLRQCLANQVYPHTWRHGGRCLHLGNRTQKG